MVPGAAGGLDAVGDGLLAFDGGPAMTLLLRGAVVIEWVTGANRQGAWGAATAADAALQRFADLPGPR